MSKIGVFDSGLGGLWVLKHLKSSMPDYDYVYYADQANVPYGSHTKNEIIEFSRNIADFLIKKDCKLIVVACNTATSVAIEFLRNNYKDIIFVGMEPAVKPACELSKTGHIGLLATKVTAEGQKLHDTIEKYAKNAEVHTEIGYGLVELVENGKGDTDEAEELLRKYLDPLVEKNIDELVLGCTHYPLLIKRIKKIVGNNVHIIDPTEAVVRRVREMIDSSNIYTSDNPQIEFYNSKQKNDDLLLHFLSKLINS